LATEQFCIVPHSARLLAAPNRADKVLTDMFAALFQPLQMINDWRRSSMTNTQAKRRQMTFLHCGPRFMRLNGDY
jgi:hypothetical protein